MTGEIVLVLIILGASVVLFASEKVRVDVVSMMVLLALLLTGLLTTEVDGNKKFFRANTRHPLFRDIHNILLKHVGFDKIIERVVNKLGSMEKLYVTGDFANGIDNPIIDLIFVGDNINKEYLVNLVEKTETLISKRIRYVVFGLVEFDNYIVNQRESDLLLLWKNGD